MFFQGCEVVISGKLRGQRAKAMKFTDGLMIHTGHPVTEYVDVAVRHVLLRQGVIGLKVGFAIFENFFKFSFPNRLKTSNTGQNYVAPRSNRQGRPQDPIPRYCRDPRAKGGGAIRSTGRRRRSSHPSTSCRGGRLILMSHFLFEKIKENIEIQTTLFYFAPNSSDFNVIPD